MDVPVLAHSLTASYHTLNLTTPHSLYSQPLTHPDDPSDAAPQGGSRCGPPSAQGC